MSFVKDLKKLGNLGLIGCKIQDPWVLSRVEKALRIRLDNCDIQDKSAIEGLKQNSTIQDMNDLKSNGILYNLNLLMDVLLALLVEALLSYIRSGTSIPNNPIAF